MISYDHGPSTLAVSTRLRTSARPIHWPLARTPCVMICAPDLMASNVRSLRGLSRGALAGNEQHWTRRSAVGVCEFITNHLLRQSRTQRGTEQQVAVQTIITGVADCIEFGTRWLLIKVSDRDAIAGH